MDKIIKVLYHGSCYDGFGAAFAAWKAFGNNAEYIPCSYGRPPPTLVSELNGVKTPDPDFVYIVDFSFKKDVMIALCLNFPKTQFVVIDHHKTAEADLKDLAEVAKLPNLDVHFDMTRSGALMTWEYFYSDKTGAVQVPKLIRHISDRDLWTYKIPGSQEVHAALVATPMDFELYDNLIKTDPTCEALIRRGEYYEEYQKTVVNKICDKFWIGPLGDHSVPMVNTTAHWSEIGEELLKRNKDYPFAASFTVFEESVMWSLRSRASDPGGGFDVSEVAKKYGGGGHRNAAGFSTVKV